MSKRIIFLVIFIVFTSMIGAQQLPIDSILPKKNNKILLLPLAIKSIETGWSFGGVAAATYYLQPNDTISRTSNTQLLALYSLKKQFVSALNGTQYFAHEKLILNEQISFSSFPDKFWGLGTKSANDAVEEYSFKQYYVNLHPWVSIANHLFIGFPFEMQRVFDVSYKNGGLFDQQQVEGRNGYYIAGIGTSLTYDTRNHAFWPSKGIYAQLFYNHFDNYLKSDFTYSNIVIDVRKYWSVNHNAVLAAQVNYFGVFGDVPLRSLALLGGSGSMRGYYSGRFRDKQLLVTQAEYRFPIYKKLGAVVFGGVANVAPSPQQFEISTFKYSYGGGLRFALNKTEKLNARLDFGIGQQGNSGFYFQIGEAF